MDDNIAIKVEHVSKKFCRTLRRSMGYGLMDVARNMLGMGSHPDRLRKNEFWAVDDVSFEVNKGEVIGIIGANGSGKTTMLSLLNGIFWPDKGKISIRGRTGALIAMGAGFHPMLSGRENIYIEGAVRGLSRQEIDERFHDIVEFADIGEFIDSPVKYYSSGMMVRLGFAVAIHMEPEVLLIDEVLAVGDMGFRTKCLQKMEELRRRGISIVFVSHNMDMVSRLCSRGLYLKEGRIHFEGGIDQVIERYETETDEAALVALSQRIRSKDFQPSIRRRGTGEAEIKEVKFLDGNGVEKDAFEMGEKMTIQIFFVAHKKIEKPVFVIGMLNQERVWCIDARSNVDGYVIDSIEGDGVMELEFPKLLLAKGVYSINVAIRSESILDFYHVIKQAYHFQVVSSKFIRSAFDMDQKWKLISQ